MAVEKHLAADPSRPEPVPDNRSRALSFLWRFLFGRKRNTADPLLEVLPEFDVETLLQEMQIREKAAENGKHEIPATGDLQPDGPQALIAQQVERAIREGKSHLETHISNLTRRIHEVDVTQDCLAIKALPATLKDDLDQLLMLYADRVVPLRDRERTIASQLAEFRKKYNLGYEPYLSPPSYLLYGVLGVILIFEAALNGRYLARANELGWLGGVTDALIIAAVNVVASVTLGRVAHWLVGGRPFLRILGGMAAVTFVIWAFVYNLIIAHARDLLGDAIDYATVAAGMGKALTEPFTFRDIESWLLLSLGILFSLGSFVDGVKWDDPTLGYTRLHDELEQARNDHLQERDHLDREARDFVTRRLAELHERADRIRYRVAALRNDVEQKRLLGARAENFFRYAVESCNTMLSIYRDLNRHHRKTRAPAYFQERWSHSEPQLLALDLSEDQARVDAQEVLRRDVDRRREATVRELESRYDEFVARMR